MTITLGWWIIPAILSVAALWWMASQDYRGDYNFNALFTVPMTGNFIFLVWLIHLTIQWALT